MLAFGPFQLNLDTFELFNDGELVAIEPQVFEVLGHLVSNRERVVSKQELFDEIWGGRFVGESALTTRIKQARQAVGDDGRTQRYIRNVHGRGYQFVGEISDTASPAPAPVPPDGATEVGQEPGQVGGLDGTAGSLLVDDEFPFVGRGQSLSAADEVLERVAAGGLGTILLGGEPGIGKTRLAAQIGHRAAAAGSWVLAGRCDRHLATSLQPFLEAIGIYVDAASDEALVADTAGIAEHLRTALPSLDSRLPSGDAMAGSSDEYAALDALVVLLERVSARVPLVMILDDVQWAGGATRALTSLLLRRSTARLALVLTFRTTADDLDDAVREWLLDLGSHGATVRLDLEGLAAEEISELVGSAGSDGAPIETAIGQQVWELSEGHTLFATELLRDVRRGIGLPHLPETVAALVTSRLDRLPAPVRQLVMVAAALGPNFSLRIAAEAAEIAPAESLEVVELALGAELVHEVAGSLDQFRFSHQLVPAAVLEEMTSIRRVRLHARIVEVLEASGAPAAQIAHHLLEAAPLLDAAEVIERVRATAEIVRVERHYDTAAGLLARCAELPMDDRTRAEILTEGGSAYNAAGRQPKALAPFDRAAELARVNRWPDLLAAAALGRWGQSPFRASQDRTVRPLINEALEGEADLEPTTVARLLAKRAAFSLFTAPLADRDALSSRADELVGPATSRDRLEVLEARWMAIASPRTAHDIASIDVELDAMRKELGALTTDACAPEIGPYWRGEGETLWTVAEELRADPRQRRDVDQWRTTTLAGTAAIFAGDVDEARRLTDQALPLGRDAWGESGEVVHALVHLLINVIDDRAEQSLETWRTVAAEVPSDNMRSTRAWVESMAGDREAAAEILGDVAPRIETMPENFMGGFGLVGFTEAALAVGDEGLLNVARTVLQPIDDRVLGHPWAPSLAAADLLARIGLRLGEGGEAEAGRDRAMAHYGQLGATTLADRLASAFDDA